MTQIREKRLKCPRCGAKYDPILAVLSRRDDKTKICDDCGNTETLEDAGLQPPYQGELYWRGG